MVYYVQILFKLKVMVQDLSKIISTLVHKTVQVENQFMIWNAYHEPKT